jgi:hypothetical protein
MFNIANGYPVIHSSHKLAGFLLETVSPERTGTQRWGVASL